MKECTCKGWTDNMPLLNDTLMSGGMWEMRTADEDDKGPFGYKGEPMKYCPWCGRDLQNYDNVDTGDM